MIRNLKAMGLALVALFALSAVVAATASAQQGKLTGPGPMTLTATETGTGQNKLTAFGAGVECPGSHYVGHKYNETPHKFIPSGATTATLTPIYTETVTKEGKKDENCLVAGVGWSATIDLNGCDYVIHLGVTTGGVENTYGVTFDIVCPVGKEITVTLWTNKTLHTAEPLKPFCILHVPPQVGLVGAHATDTTEGHIDLTGEVEKIKVTRTNQGSHAILCPNSTTETAKFDLDVTVDAHNELGETIDIGISH